MSEYAIEHRSALGGKKPVISASVKVGVLPEGHVLHVLSASADVDLSGTIRASLGCDALAIRAVSPGQWFIVGNETLSVSALLDIVRKLKPHAEVVDQSHGRIRIAIAGPKATSVLAKGTGADLALSSFPVGHATATLIGHIGAHLTRISEDEFELMVLRGFAESLWDELIELSGEYR
ncbi:sarcosine oxidase subunit gamma family protein [Mesorhizobium sp.]|uniref:sarcosine oxidase subunit gamma family protein n=1 Tax=Mesorhizobium sp. TaxID=1871066 RepID=UPI000FE746AF|nr:sarcosine oxidase subunit gamma family protein [Mesorhizobium sp.]RWD51030.1 MAG: sarcosine oxidase subunit gamma [Mesorhizobium sp.]RWD96101.1 MAG: sarcosine oxidase subunit gamma [Mesorhizobium sp.]